MLKLTDFIIPSNYTSATPPREKMKERERERERDS
jgi:hypothetical protein